MGTYRTIPSDRALPPSLVPLFMEYEWQRLSLVTTTTGSQYTEVYTNRIIAPLCVYCVYKDIITTLVIVIIVQSASEWHTP